MYLSILITLYLYALGAFNLFCSLFNGLYTFNLCNSGLYFSKFSSISLDFLDFNPIPLIPKKCGLSIHLYICVQGRIREWRTLTYTPFFIPYKILYVCSLYIIDYLIGLAFWAIPIGL